MDRHPPFQLGYTHEVAASASQPFVVSSPVSWARDLTQRLQGLKAQYDLERDRSPRELANWPVGRRTGH